MLVQSDHTGLRIWGLHVRQQASSAIQTDAMTSWSRSLRCSRQYAKANGNNQSYGNHRKKRNNKTEQEQKTVGILQVLVIVFLLAKKALHCFCYGYRVPWNALRYVQSLRISCYSCFATSRSPRMDTHIAIPLQPQIRASTICSRTPPKKILNYPL